MLIGNMTNCYTQAILTVLMDNLSFENLIKFEIASSVPFGIIYKSNDPNRTLDCYIDPDIGIDRALNQFSIPFEVKYWAKGYDSAEAIENLNDWLEDSPVVLGPVNMGKLTYLPQYNLYSGIDHYIVVTKKSSEGYYVCDPEGVPFTFISKKQLNEACISGDLSEGRGSYTIRRIFSKVKRLNITNDILNKNMAMVLENFLNASAAPNGGPNGLRQLADDIAYDLNDPSIVRGLKYILTNRIQRCMVAEHFYLLFKRNTTDTLGLKTIENVIQMQRRQKQLYSEFLSLIFDKYNLNIFVIQDVIYNIASLENLITDSLLGTFKNLLIER